MDAGCQGNIRNAQNLWKLCMEKFSIAYFPLSLSKIPLENTVLSQTHFRLAIRYFNSHPRDSNFCHSVIGTRVEIFKWS